MKVVVSKQSKRQITQFLLHWRTEQAILLIQFVALTMLLIHGLGSNNVWMRETLATDNRTNEHLFKNVTITSYEATQDLNKFFDQAQVVSVKAPSQILPVIEKAVSPAYDLQAAYLPYVPLVPPRLIQLRVSQNDICEEADRYNIECNQLYTDVNRTKIFESRAPDAANFTFELPEDEKQCAVQNCEEYHFRSAEVTSVKNKALTLDPYNFKNTFFVDLYEDEGLKLAEKFSLLDQEAEVLLKPKSKQIKALQKNKWIDERTRVVVVDQLLLEPQTNATYSVKFTYEMEGDGAVAHARMTVSAIEPIYLGFQFIYIPLVALLLVWVIHALKIIVLLRFGIANNLIITLEFVYTAVLFIFLLSKSLSLLMCIKLYEFRDPWFVQTQDVWYDQASDIRSSFRDTYDYQQYEQVSLCLLLIFVPFKLFQFLIHFAMFADIKGTLNVWIRMYPGIFMSFNISFFLIIPMFCFSSMILVGQNWPECSGLLISWTSIMMGNFPPDVQSTLWAWSVTTFKGFVMVYLVAYFTLQYKLAAKFDGILSPQSESSIFFKNMVDNIAELATTIVERYTKMQKTRSSKIGTFKNKKIVGWLINRPQEEHEKLQRKRLFSTFTVPVEETVEFTKDSSLFAKHLPQTSKLVLEKIQSSQTHDKMGQRAQVDRKSFPISKKLEPRTQGSAFKRSASLVENKKKISFNEGADIAFKNQSPDVRKKKHQGQEPIILEVEPDKEAEEIITIPSSVKRSSRWNNQGKQSMPIETPGYFKSPTQKFQSFVMSTSMADSPSPQEAPPMINLPEVTSQSSSSPSPFDTTLLQEDNMGEISDDIDEQVEIEAPCATVTETIEFETDYQMRNFMNGLFQLKPYLITSYSLNVFRIVVEIVIGKHQKACLKGLQQVVQYLAEYDCKVPLMIYTQPSKGRQAELPTDEIKSPLSRRRSNLAQVEDQFALIDKNTFMLLQKKYKLLFKTSKVEVVQAFCKMEPLYLFKQI